MDDVGYILSRETNGDPNARNPRSSAAGLGQFIDSTWLDMLSRHRPDLAQGRSPAELLSLKSDPSLSIEMTKAYAADNNAKLAKAGLPVNAGTTYLAHFAGPDGAVRVLSAQPDTPVAQLLDAKAIAANPHIQGMTAADLAAWAAGNRKVGNPTKPSNAPKPTNVGANMAGPAELGDVFANFAPAMQFPLTASTSAPPIPPPSGGNGPFLDDPAFAPRTYARLKAKHREVLG
jgi:hypothetical protein